MTSQVSATTETTRTGSGFGYRSETMTPIHWAAFGLAAVTGAIHIYLYYMQGNPAFLFAGAIFFGAVAAGLLNV